MLPLILIGMGAIVGLVGAMVLATTTEVADDLSEQSESVGGPTWMYTPGSAGCAGLASIAIGIVIFIAGIISFATGGLG